MEFQLSFDSFRGDTKKNKYLPEENNEYVQNSKIFTKLKYNKASKK